MSMQIYYTMFLYKSLKMFKKFFKCIYLREKGKHWFVVSLTYVFIGWYLYVSWLGIEPATLAYGDDALTNGAPYVGLKRCF